MYYPFYAKCAELGVPIQIQVGHSAQWFLRTVAQPITLDRVAIDFPELKIIGIHIGHPWTEEMISMAWKHPNVFIGTDAHLPKYWDKTLINFINSRGQDKDTGSRAGGGVPRHDIKITRPASRPGE